MRVCRVLSNRYQYERSPGGLDAIRLQNDRLELAIVPQAGGKIVDLIDRCSGRNWLWKNPHIPVSVATGDSDFGKELDSGGWDEVLLAIKPGRIHSLSENIAAIPDHGDLLASDWWIEDVRAEDEETRLQLCADSEQRWPNLVLADGECRDLARSFASDAARLIFCFDPEELPWMAPGAERCWSLKVELQS